MGGFERARKLTDEERQEIARQGAYARWAHLNDPNHIPEAKYQGLLQIGAVGLDCYVLNDRRRLFHKRGMAKAMGLKSTGGNAFMKTISRKGLGSEISEELWEKINNPILFKPLNGDPAHGYEAPVLIDVCDAIIQARNEGKLVPSQYKMALHAEIIIRSAAKFGIVALIDEATGFIADKRKEEYRELFKEFIRNECREWSEAFPPPFFDMLYRLYGLRRVNPHSNRHPRFFAHFIRRYVYRPLANSNGAILEQREEKNPVVYINGGRRYNLHQFLEKIGLKALDAHVWQVIGIGNASRGKTDFERSFHHAFPQPGTQFGFNFDLEV
jgi:P63C domain-containing protein